MTTPKSDRALEAAQSFLAPVLDPESVPNLRGLSIIERLSSSIQDSENNVLARKKVILRALELVSHLHESQYDSQQGILGSNRSGDFINPMIRRTIHGLLDLISIEGIYPSLSPDVGLPLELRVKSTLKGTSTTSQNVGLDQIALQKSLLPHVLKCLLPISLASKGLGPWIRDRIFVDLLISAFELAYNPNIPNDSREASRKDLEKMVDGSSISILFPALTSLLRPEVPSWLRPHLSGTLSLLPLRPNGVRQTVEFIASRSSDATVSDDGPRADSERRTSPRIHLDAVTQASRLLAAVPSSLTPAEFFDKVGPQLLRLLDGEAGSDMIRVAGYVIGSGILGRKSLGSPGTAGWQFFAEPILSTIDPGRPTLESSPPPTHLGTLVSETNLDLATKRLAVLFHSHPNPALARRLLGQVILPLWGLLVHSKQNRKTRWYQRTKSLVYTYYSIAADPTALKTLSLELTYDGGKSWTFAPGSQGGIEIRLRSHASEASIGMLDLLSSLDSRIEEFLHLASSDSVSDSSISPLFIGIIHEWLRTSRARNIDIPLLAKTGSDDIKDPFTTLVNARLLQGILERLKERLARSPTQILELVKELSADFVTNLELAAKSKNSNPTYRNLGSIVEEDDESKDQSLHDEFEVISIAISLLSAVVSSSEFKPSNSENELVSSIRESLNSPIISKSGLPIALSGAISNVKLLLEIRNSNAQGQHQQSAAGNSSISEDQKTFTLSQIYVTDPLPPVRAQGLALLQGLIEKQSPLIDVPVTTILVLSLLQDTEEYIYLFAIKLLALLASNHPDFVIEILTETYEDKEGNVGLNQRLRLGEALQRTVERLGNIFGSDIAQKIGSVCIDIAGRRARRPKDAAAAEKKRKVEDQNQKEAEQAWGGEVPNLELGDDELAERLASTLDGWQGKDGEEDIRIRTSALSVLATAIKTNLESLGPDLASSGLDNAMAILTQERGDGRAILRRAAVLLVLSLVKALDTARDEGQQLGFSFAGARLDDVLRTLKYIEATDDDDLVKGHTRTVIEGLEDSTVKALLGVQHPLQNSSLAGSFVGPLTGLTMRPDTDVGVRRIEEIE